MAEIARLGCGVEQFSLPFTVYAPVRARLSGMLSGVSEPPVPFTLMRVRKADSLSPAFSSNPERGTTILIVPSTVYPLAGSAAVALPR